MDQPTKYFVQRDVDGSCYAFYRERYENHGSYEEVWQRKYKRWMHIPWRLLWYQINGELEQVSFEQFKKMLPEAFKG